MNVMSFLTYDSKFKKGPNNINLGKRGDLI